VQVRPGYGPAYDASKGGFYSVSLLSVTVEGSTILP